MIENPVLRGFHPDPSIIRVGNDYYIANSTFEWFPGVQIYHSTDLVNWKLAAVPLNTKKKLNLTGVPDSGGVWAPCLSYCDGIFYLVYSISRSWNGVYKDVDNYLVTADSVNGEWSDPIYMGCAGFDASLFHDLVTGKKWYTCVNWDYRQSSEGNSVECFKGILLQEYDPVQKRLIGKVTNIFKGTELGLVEAPHQYYINGYYYLMTAEGGTFEEHAVTLCRSKQVDGPYELHPNNPVLTSYGDAGLYLHRSGHASLIETPDGEWYLAHLCGRPHMPEVRCNLGRETALQKMEWKDDWLYVEGGGNRPKQFVPEPGNVMTKREMQTEFMYNFRDNTLPLEFNSLRDPMDEDWISLGRKQGTLSIRGRESMYSKHFQSTVARRVQHFNCIAETKLRFTPDSHFQSAGLIYFYDTENHYYLRITHIEDKGTVCNILISDTAAARVTSESVSLQTNEVTFRFQLSGKTIRFYCNQDGKNFIPVGEPLDATKMSDEYCKGHFTGSFAGMHVEDMAQKQAWAEFEYFKYKEI